LSVRPRFGPQLHLLSQLPRHPSDPSGGSDRVHHRSGKPISSGLRTCSGRPQAFVEGFLRDTRHDRRRNATNDLPRARVSGFRLRCNLNTAIGRTAPLIVAIHAWILPFFGRTARCGFSIGFELAGRSPIGNSLIRGGGKDGV
jgi:hypothetical protein